MNGSSNQVSLDYYIIHITTCLTKPSTPGYISQPLATLSLRHLQKHPGVERLSTPGCVKKALSEKKNTRTMASSSMKSTDTTVIHSHNQSVATQCRKHYTNIFCSIIEPTREQRCQHTDNGKIWRRKVDVSLCHL